MLHDQLAELLYDDGDDYGFRPDQPASPGQFKKKKTSQSQWGFKLMTTSQQTRVLATVPTMAPLKMVGSINVLLFNALFITIIQCHFYS